MSFSRQSLLSVTWRLGAAALSLAALQAQAHITLETPQAEAGSYYKAVFRVGHGCAGSPTRELVVTVPEGAQGAKPQPKPGWVVATETAPLTTPSTSHGRTLTEDVRTVRWSGGPLADAHYDEFVLRVKLPEQPGTMHWKVSQVCENGRTDWHDLPSSGSSVQGLKSPAAVLEIVPKAHAGHAH